MDTTSFMRHKKGAGVDLFIKINLAPNCGKVVEQ